MQQSSISAEFISLAIKCQALRFGDFILKSGRTSPFFFNSSKFCQGYLKPLSSFYAQQIIDTKLNFDVLFGTAYKGIPLVATIATALAEKTGKEPLVTFNRKETKTHSEGGDFIGASFIDSDFINTDFTNTDLFGVNVIDGDLFGADLFDADFAQRKVLIIDDVLSSGISTRLTAQLIKNAGGIVAGLVVGLNRQETSPQQWKKLQQLCNGNIEQLATIDDLCVWLEKEPEQEDNLATIQNHIKSIRAYFASVS